jgi:hypothetical protein
VRLLHRLAVVDDGGEHARLARPALRHQAQRLRRSRRQLLINKEFGVKMLGQLAAWQKDHIYSYGGRQARPIRSS